jgi:Transposase DDE domain
VIRYDHSIMTELPGKSADATKPWPEKLLGVKYVRLIEKHLHALRGEPTHGNQKLFLDDVFVAYLLAFFNPTVRSLRTLHDFSQAPPVQSQLNIRSICKSTLSDFNKLVDPERLTPILTALRAELSRKQAGNHSEGDLNALLRNTVAVDGTFIPAVAEIAWAVAHANNHKGVHHRARLDLHLNVFSWVPEAIVVPDVGQSEADSAIANIQPGKIYLYDRGYISFDLIRAHYDKIAAKQGTKVAGSDDSTRQPASHFVIRFKPAGGNSPVLCDATERALTDAERAAGVISDRVGNFPSAYAHRSGIDKLHLREVVIEYVEDGKIKTLRLITNLLDVSASTIGMLYRNRWQVELFFRWLKSFGNFGHLISHTREGVLTHFYVAIIGVMLMYLHTGHRPSKYLFSLMSLVASGAATLEDILPILRERERQSALARLSAARRRAKKS